METHDSYLTVGRTSSTEYRVRDSKFHAAVYPVASPEEAEERLKQCGKEHHAAAHHCFAYKLQAHPSPIRYSDDGEPSGTAGKPILLALDHSGLTDVLIVVHRYFGGTKLGTGGLTRAYGEAARLVLLDAEIINIPVFNRFRIVFPYIRTSGVMRILTRYGLKIFDTSYAEDVSIDLGIPPSLIHVVPTELRDITNGNIDILNKTPEK